MYNTLKNIFRSPLIRTQAGSSLVQVMVISGMVSVFGLAVMQTAKNMSSLRQTEAMRESIEQFKDTFSNMMLEDSACVNTLRNAGVTTRSQALTDRNITRIYDGEDDIAYTLYDEATMANVYHGNIRIKEIEFYDFNPAENLGKIRIEVYKKYFDSGDSDKSFGSAILGGDTIEFELPLRVFFEIPDGAASSPSDVLATCFAEYRNELSGVNPLEELCDDDLGGSYYNGRCLITEYIMDKTRCWEDGTCGDPADAATSLRSICHNLGGRFDSGTGKCTQRFKDVQACQDNQVVRGFDAEGRFICIPAP